MGEAPPRRLWPLVARALRFVLLASGVAAWIAAVACYWLDASPLDNFDVAVHLSWVRSIHGGEYRGQSDGQPTPATVEGVRLGR